MQSYTPIHRFSPQTNGSRDATQVEDIDNTLEYVIVSVPKLTGHAMQQRKV